jgi:hypothetical protein
VAGNQHWRRIKRGSDQHEPNQGRDIEGRRDDTSHGSGRHVGWSAAPATSAEQTGGHPTEQNAAD